MIVNIGKLCFVLFRSCSLSEWLDAKRTGWFAFFSANGMYDALAVVFISSRENFSWKYLAEPLPHDVFHLFCFQSFVGEKIVHDRG